MADLAAMVPETKSGPKQRRKAVIGATIRVHKDARHCVSVRRGRKVEEQKLVDVVVV